MSETASALRDVDKSRRLEGRLRNGAFCGVAAHRGGEAP